MSTDGKLRLIQCGVGGFGKAWIDNYSSKSPDFDLAAIVDASPKNLNDAGDRLNIPAALRFDSLEKALDAVKADAVLTVTPPAVHVQHARLAFARGLHLITEKPLADTIENAKEMIRLAKQANRHLVVSQNYRFRPCIQTMRRLVAERAVGSFGHGHMDFYIPADFTGTFRETMDFPLLVDMAIHHLDLIRAVTGCNIVKVTAQSFRPSWSWYKHDPGLKMLMELQAPDGARLPFSYSGDWSARGKDTSWNGQWRLQCEEGSIHLEKDEITIGREGRWAANPSVELVTLDAMPRENQAHTLWSLAEAIRTGKSPETNAQDNLWSFAAVMAGVQSARENRPVDIEELVKM